LGKGVDLGMRYYFLLNILLATDKISPVPNDFDSEGLCQEVPSKNESISMLKSFYASRGIWSGIYHINKTLKMELKEQQFGQYEYHVQYAYQPIPNNRLGRNDTGQDQRIFYFMCDEMGWQVESMGPFMSAFKF
jgi:hypothetical protein